MSDIRTVERADDPWLRHVDYLRTSLLAPRDGQASSLYLLVDTRSQPDLQKRWVEDRSWRYVSLWDGLSTAAYHDIAPYLIAIEPDVLDGRDGRHALLRQLWMDVADRPMLTWVASPFGLDALAQHFRRFCTFRNPALRLFYLHFYDNRVLTRLHQGFEPALWQAFVAPCHALGSRDRRNRPVVWRNSQPPLYTPDPTPLMLSEVQHRRLLEVGYPDKLAMQLRRSCDVDEDEVADADWIERVETQLARAATYGLKEEQALARYTILGVLISRTFDEHPAVQPILQRLADGESASATLDAVEAAVERHVDELTGNGCADLYVRPAFGA
ncbi:DUF4123 domain-containing protein [Burkholderia contaminans]|uniref:DUF4123 domain-containing protein n=1 Tax=Burkholderia contaminans TaxID=488447 RepID=UPI00145321E5|nr:DUF4123 domain-containing protein [Burkholderia contaminans]MCA8153201.1 DUF4123 domain-containing protein [Burkholderia contaminans]VWD47080.1 hypothetical protein BCO19218_05844 [Burkholderia contaminans]